MGTSPESAIDILKEEGIGALKKCPFILGSVDDISGRVAYSELRNAGIKPHVVATSGNMPTLLSLCSEGLGAVFCPTDMLDYSPMASPICCVSLFPPSRATPSNWAFRRAPNAGRWSIPFVAFCWRLRRKNNFCSAEKALNCSLEDGAVRALKEEGLSGHISML